MWYKRGFLKLLLSVLLLMSVIGCTEKTDSIYEKITVRLPIPVVDGAFGPLYIAQDLGFFEKYGLEVDLEPGSPELNPIKMVDQKIDEIGIAGGPELFISGRDAGAKIQAFGLLHKNSNFSTLLVKEDSGIYSVDDLQGKKVGFFYGHISTDIIRELLAQENVNVEEVDVGFNYQLLINDEIDAQRAFTTTAGVTLPFRGVEVREISPKKYGITTHGYTFFAHEETLSENPDIIHKFVQALKEAIDYSLTHREETIESVIVRDKGLERAIIEKQLDLYEKAIEQNKRYLRLDARVFKEAYQRLKNQKLITGGRNIEDSLYSIKEENDGN